MKAKYILEAIAKLRSLANECDRIANMLEFASGMQSVEVAIEPPTSLRDQFDRESA